MNFLSIDNPTRTPNQTLDIPFGSRVFITLKPNAFSNLYFKLLCLDDNMWPEHNLVWPNLGSIVCLPIIQPHDTLLTSYYFYTENNLTISKLYLNEISEPFSRVVNAKVYGATQAVDGITTKTADRLSYIGNDGNTYLFDTVELETLIYQHEVVTSDIDDWTFTTQLGILRNSEGTILGYASYGLTRTASYKIGRRVVNVPFFTYEPSTISSGINIKLLPKEWGLYNTSTGTITRISGIPDANVSLVGEVEISDCPNISYTVADPITVPIKINYQNKSYSFIEF